MGTKVFKISNKFGSCRNFWPTEDVDSYQICRIIRIVINRQTMFLIPTNASSTAHRSGFDACQHWPSWCPPLPLLPGLTGPHHPLRPLASAPPHSPDALAPLSGPKPRRPLEQRLCCRRKSRAWRRADRRRRASGLLGGPALSFCLCEVGFLKIISYYSDLRRNECQFPCRL